MTRDTLRSHTFAASDQEFGPIRSRIERLNRVRDFVSAVGRKDGISVISELIRDHNAGNIRTVTAENLDHPFFMTAAYSDVAMFTEIVGRRLYDSESMRVLERRITGLPIVDIGAYIGASTAYFASRYPESKVTAIEPDTRNYELLCYNAGQYKGRIDPWKYALSLEPGYVDVSNDEVGDVGHHALYRYDKPAEEKDIRAVRAITPAQIVERVAESGRIGLLKVNIEGAENEIFASPSSDILLQKTNIAIIEAHSQKIAGADEVILKAAARNGLMQFDQRGPFRFFMNTRRSIKNKITL